MACQGQCTIRNVDAVDQGMWSSLNKTGFAVVLITMIILYSWDQLVSICRCICSARTTVVQVSSYRNAKVLNAVIRVRGIVTYDFQPTKDFQYVLRVIDGAIQVKGRRIVELNGSQLIAVFGQVCTRKRLLKAVTWPWIYLFPGNRTCSKAVSFNGKTNKVNTTRYDFSFRSIQWKRFISWMNPFK